MQNYLNQLPQLFNVDLRFQILSNTSLSCPSISGAHTYVCAIYKRHTIAELALGYAFEHFILYAQAHGLSTCWIAGTFNRKTFPDACSIQNDEYLAAITPLGYASAHPSLKDSLISKALHARNRLPFETLFFKDDFAHPLSLNDATHYLLPLQMVQLAPSAKNLQPWRVVNSHNSVHFFEAQNKGLSSPKGGDIQKIDLGIALAHFTLAAQELDLKGTIAHADPQIELQAHTQYVVSWIQAT